MWCYCNKYLKMWKQLWNWVMGRGWKILEVHARKRLHCCEGTVKGSEGEGENPKESLNLLREYLSGCEQNVGRNKDNINQKGNRTRKFRKFSAYPYWNGKEQERRQI